MKRVFTLILSLLLAFSIVHIGVFATENEESSVPEDIPKPTFITQPQDITTTVDTTVTISFEAKIIIELTGILLKTE